MGVGRLSLHPPILGYPAIGAVALSEDKQPSAQSFLLGAVSKLHTLESWKEGRKEAAAS